MKVLIICTGNSCRSQMAHGFMESFDSNIIVCSAGTQAIGRINKKAVEVMKEVGIDISNHTSDPIEMYLEENWDYIITVCSDANENCPVFPGRVTNRLHFGFDDPSKFVGSPEFIWNEYRRVRDEIKNKFFEFYQTEIRPKMIKPDNIKFVIQEKYGEIVKGRNSKGGGSCCGTSSCCGNQNINMSSDGYKEMEGYVPDADFGLGCGIPTHLAAISKGDSILDLGSGAGNDCFVARAIVGETGSITGLDFTGPMIAKATENNKKLGYSNVRFVQGDIEEMPFPESSFDVVISNCVLNLVPDKERAFAEIMRVLKPKGHFCVSDVVTKGELSKNIREDVGMYVGCIAGAVDMDQYLSIISRKGFTNITVHTQNRIELPEEILKSVDAGIFSITVSAYKP